MPVRSDVHETVTSGSGSLQVDVGSGSTDATLTESVDVGTPMDGPGSDPEADPGCAELHAAGGERRLVRVPRAARRR